MTPRLCIDRLSRAALLRGTALQAAVALTLIPTYVQPASAQPAPNARPQGGQVVGGSATIARAPGSTTVTQSTDRAAIDWRSFDVGRNQTVTFQQPSATSATLNRVTGADPSAIAGRISANGQVILTNPNGVTFFKGSQVNAQSLVVSAPGISNQNFMAGRMVFDQASKPGARVENAGTITVKQAGLAALVAPSVANSGTINARLGTVILAGAAAHTLDMYGDGLVSIDVTKQVRQAPNGPGGKPVTALVTNTGTIIADGGSIQLTARAADGVVQTLVDARGTLQANTVESKTGRIEIAGTGGGVVIAGRISADSRTGQAGTIVLNGSTATTLTDTAHVTANGGTRGGTIAVGTTLARARTTGPAPAATSAHTTVAAGARLAANATNRGNGGRVTVLSTASTEMAGRVDAKGGAHSGNGGTIELSGETGFRLTGHSDTSAPHGTAGTVVIDPRDLLITNNPPPNTRNQPAGSNDPNIAANDGGTTTDAYVTPGQLQNQSGTIHVLTTRDLTVDTSLNRESSGGIILEAGRNLTVTSNGSISTSGNLLLIAASSAISGFDPAGTLSLAGAISGQGIVLNGGTGGIALAANVSANATLSLGTQGAVTQTAGIVSTPQLYGRVGSVSLSSANAIDGVGNGQNASFQTTTGGFSLINQPGRTLTIGSPAGGGGLVIAAGQPVSLAVDGLVLNAAEAGKAITAPGSTLLLRAATADRTILVSATSPDTGGNLVVPLDSLSRLSIGTLQLGSGVQPIVLGQSDEAVNLTAAGIGKLVLSTDGNISQGGPLTVADLAVSTTGGVDLSNTANRIDTLSALAVNSPTAITTAGNLALTGNIGADNATIRAGGNITLSAAGSLTASDSLALYAGDPSIPGANAAAALTLAGRVRPANTLTLSAGTGGIALTGSVFATDIVIDTAGALTQGTAGTSATDLRGAAGSVSLSSAQNSIVGVSDFGTLSGGFLLVDSTALTVGSISVASRQTIDLITDGLTLRGEGSALQAANGVVALQPFTSGTPILLTSSAKPAGTFALTTAELGQISAFDLILGGTNPGTGQSSAGTITLGKPGEAIDLTRAGVGALGLNTTGAVVQGGPLAVGTLSANAGSITLVTAGNRIGTTAGVSATGDIALHTDGDLSVGFTQAGGNLSLSSGGQGGMTLFGALRGQTVNLNSLNSNASIPTSTDPGIVQTDGSITATTLTGAAGSAKLGNANAVAGLGDFATYGGLQLNNGGSPLTLTGIVSTTTGAVTLTAAGLAQTAGSRLITPEFDGASSATTVLTARGNAVGAIGSFSQTAGDFTLVTSTPTLGIGGVSASTGSLTFVADGIGNAGTSSVAGGISASGGSVTFTPYTAGRRIELIGTSAADPNALSIGAGTVSALSAQRLVLGTTGTVGIGNSGETIDLRNAVGTLQLQVGGAVTEGAGTSLRVGTLTGTAGSLSLSSATNGIDVVDSLSTTAGALDLRTGGALAAGTVASSTALTLTSGGDLTARGPIAAGSTASLVAAGAVTTTGRVGATDIAINAAAGITQSAGSLVATNSVSLTAPGRAIMQTGGTIQAASLTASADSISLPDANAIASASITATGNVTLSDASRLTLLGLTADSAAVKTSGGLTLRGRIVANDLSLSATGAIAQAGGTVTADTLSLASANRILLDRSNTVARLTTGNSVGGFTLVDTGALTVTTAINDPTAITLRTGGDLALAGRLSTAALTLAAGGAITQPGGSIVANTLSTTSSAATTLGQGNAIATLLSASSKGGLTVVDTGNLVARGPLSDPTAITLRTGGDLTLAGPIATGNLAFAAGGAITQSAGTISASTVGGTAGSATLNQANAISTLAGFTTAGSFSLTDASRLTVAGSVTAGSGANPGQTVALTTADLVFGPGGRLIAPGGTVSLAEYTPGQGITLGGSGIPFSADTLVIGSATAGRINITGAFDLSGLTLDLRSAADIVESGAGAIKATALTGVANNVSLTGRNQIGTLGRFTAAGGFTLDNAADLAVTGPVTAANVALSSTGSLTLAGSIATRGTLTLTAAGAVTQPAGSLTAAGLRGSAASAQITQSNNIGALAGFSTEGSFALADSAALAITGPVSVGAGQTITLNTPGLSFASGGFLNAPGGTVSIAEFGPGSGVSVGGSGGGITARAVSIGSATGGTITITGALDVSTGALDLQSAGSIKETAGAVITAGTLTGRAGSTSSSEVTLSGANRVGTLGNFTTGGSLSFANAIDLGVAGRVTAGNIALSSAGNLALSGTLVTQGAVTLRAGGDITQPGGSIAASSLGGSATNASLGQASNAVGTLAEFLTTGNFSYATSGSLNIGDTVTGRTVAFDVGGGLAEAGAGRLIAGLLSGRADSAALTGANQVDTVAFTTSNGFALNDVRPMTVVGPLTDRAAGIALTAPSITFAGSVAAPSLTLTSPGAVTQITGALSVGTLTGSIGSLDIGNQGQASVGTLGALTATNAINLTDQASLRVAGPLTAPAFAITASGLLTLDGGTIRTDGQSLAAQLGSSPGAGGSTFAVRPGPTGTASLVQLGTTTLTSLSGGTATLRLGLVANGGTLALNDLEAPGGNVVLALGNGAATGKLNVGNLAVLGLGGSANLTGRIGTRSDPAAAQGAQLLPGTDLRYTFNSCAIAAISCSSEALGSITLPTAAIVSVLRPDILTLGILDLTVTRDHDDPTLLLPNISDRDY